VGESSDGASGARKLGLSPEEIEKVKKEWEETQKKKKEKEEAKKKEKEEKEKDGKDKEESKDTDKKPSSPISSATTSAARPSPTPTHQRFTLHRDMFALRLSEHRKRRQAAQAKELAPRFPGAPRGGVI